MKKLFRLNFLTRVAVMRTAVHFFLSFRRNLFQRSRGVWCSKRFLLNDMLLGSAACLIAVPALCQPVVLVEKQSSTIIAPPHFEYPFAQANMKLRASFDQENLPMTSHASRLPEEGTAPAKRSVLKAALFSAVLPGAGQIYNRSYLSGLLFLGIEASGFYLNRKYNRDGDRLTGVFEAFANLHWSEDRYWDSLARDSGGQCSASDLVCLREYERQSFSHFLPITKNQTYFENIGKYDQFNAGWDDSNSGDARQRDSENREAYTFMRLETNDKYKIAATGVTVVLVNHLVSALHAAYVTNNHNRMLANSSLKLGMEKHDRQLVPVVHFKMAW